VSHEPGARARGPATPAPERIGTRARAPLGGFAIVAGDHADRLRLERALTNDPLDALLEVSQTLEAMGLEYAVGGSVASSIFGEPRSSADADLLVALPRSRMVELVQRLEPSFYVSEDAVRDAVARNASFNAIHLASMYKVDLFVAGPSALDREQLARRITVDLGAFPARRTWVTAPENLVLRKLDWYRLGGGLSELQWRDILGVLKVQGSALDLEYMRRLAGGAGLSDLLERAVAETAAR
jgi:hypothetical protein